MEKRAVLYVEDSQNILELANYLVSAGWTIYSDGKTAELLKENHIHYKTCNPLGNLNSYKSEGYAMIRHVFNTNLEDDSNPDFTYYLLCINLKPRLDISQEQNSKKLIPDAHYFLTYLLRTGVSNYKNILVLTDPQDYKETIIQLRTDSVSLDYRLYLTGKAFNMISAFDAAKAYSILRTSPFAPEYKNFLSLPFIKSATLHYGSNTQQTAAIYEMDPDVGALSGFKKIQGRELTHKIITDVSFAWDQISMLSSNLKNQFTVKSENCDGYPFTTQFTPMMGMVFTVLVKHHTIFGAGLDTNVYASFMKTLNYDKDTNDHSVIGCGAVIDETAAQEMMKYSFHAIVAPGYTEKAREILSENRGIRLIMATRNSMNTHSMSFLDCGMLVQKRDSYLFDKWLVPTKNRPTQKLVDELAFGTVIAMSIYSYGAVAIKDNRIVGISGGFGSRAKSLENVAYEANQTFKENPSEDGKVADILVTGNPIQLCDPIKNLVEKGLSAILQTGGHPNDRELIDYCDEHGVSMIFTGLTHYSY